ncbi:MAG: arylamine N-acetyltransferase [Clostridiales bacterium]|nr:arylamine N-acetyltransferase [Clostridiales bacterium]
MSPETFSLDAYFNRINYHGKTDVSFETLNALHIAHTFNITFENLDIYLHKPILLDKDALFNKLVVNRRGGYCFEMNGLFSIVLRELGFKVTDLLAGMRLHQVLMVELDDKRYLVDVGYGNDGIAAPLLIEEGIEQRQFTNTYRFVVDPAFGYMLQRKSDGDYQPMYAFTLQECSPFDYIISNHFTATHPESFFKKMKFCTMPTREGRITLTDQHFKVIKNGRVSEQPISGDTEFNELLKKHFGLDLDHIKN